jgi:L-2-hydroxyglutarate oxidase
MLTTWASSDHRQGGNVTTAKYDITIVGAGIVGLATAMALTERRPDLKLVILEKESRVAAHQTGNNSGVIHAGLYYKPGSLKARMAVEGARRMVEFCQQHDLPYELCGKVVVATSEEEIPRLDELYRRGTANGVPGLERITAEQIGEYEPAASGVAALWSPKTGIVDYVRVSEKYAQIIQERGGELRLDTKAIDVHEQAGGLCVETTRGEIEAGALINCSGLQSDLVAKMMGDTQGTRIVPFRGEYYELVPERSDMVRGLIYPVPDPRFPFLGVHFTKKLDGSVEAGPNAVLAFAREGYRKTDIDPVYLARLVAFRGFWIMAAKYWKTGLGEMYRSVRKPAFVRALQVLAPAITIDDVERGGAGVRAQAMARNGDLLDDFRFVEGPRAIHVLNAPSPAATASLVIGEAIADKALESLRI